MQKTILFGSAVIFSGSIAIANISVDQSLGEVTYVGDYSILIEGKVQPGQWRRSGRPMPSQRVAGPAKMVVSFNGREISAELTATGLNASRTTWRMNGTFVDGVCTLFTQPASSRDPAVAQWKGQCDRNSFVGKQSYDGPDARNSGSFTLHATAILSVAEVTRRSQAAEADARARKAKQDADYAVWEAKHKAELAAYDARKEKERAATFSSKLAPNGTAYSPMQDQSGSKSCLLKSDISGDYSVNSTTYRGAGSAGQDKVVNDYGGAKKFYIKNVCSRDVKFQWRGSHETISARSIEQWECGQYGGENLFGQQVTIESCSGFEL